jgi:hypothetical protein
MAWRVLSAQTRESSNQSTTLDGTGTCLDVLPTLD